MTTEPVIRVCLPCELAAMLSRGAIAGAGAIAVESGHSQCEIDGCECGCEFSLRHQCPDCRRPGMTRAGWDAAGRPITFGARLGEDGHCVDKTDCANTMLATFAATRERLASEGAADRERRQKTRRNPARAASTTSAGSACTCGCGETTGGGFYRPGHDAKHVSMLTKAVLANEMPREEACGKVAHSDRLVAKLEKALDAAR